MKNKSTLSGQRGFSLVELLVVIAVIGIIAAIAIPNIANITGNATYAKNQRNAQSICSVANAAVAAGYNGSGWTDKGSVISSLAGTNAILVTNANNASNVMSFSVSTMSQPEQDGAKDFISFAAPTTVNYVAAGGQGTN